MKSRVAIAVTLLVLGVLPGCSRGQSTVSAGDAIFKGLPPEVVREALAMPYVQQQLQPYDPNDPGNHILAQAIVRNIIFCREGLRVYQTWVETGQRPTIAPGPVPETPLEPGNTSMLETYSRLEQAVKSGEPQNVKLVLAGEATCGQWVPAAPGGAQIIQQVLEGMHG